MAIGPQQKYHRPIMLEEILGFLAPSPEKIYLDGTLGTGGHANAFLTRSVPSGRVIGIDADAESLNIAKSRLAHFGDRILFVHGRYEDARKILSVKNLPKVHGVLLDLGISQVQLEMPGRGFSFQREDPLDMRMDKTQGISAGQLLNSLSEGQMADLFHSYGEERWARRIARALVQRRKAEADIVTTKDLVDTIYKAIPKKGRPRRIHPATRVFMALRIAVNRELEALEAFLDDLPDLLCQAGRCCILSFHSLEDRIVKNRFRQWEQRCQCTDRTQPCTCEGQPMFRRLNKKVIRPQQEEIVENRLARSAKLRVAERL